VSSTSAENTRHPPARNTVLAGLVGSGGGGRRAFIDATGTPVALPATLRRVVATDDGVGALLLGLGVPLTGCAATLADIEAVGAPRAPDPKAVAALRPDVIVTGAVGGVHDLANRSLVETLRRVAPVVAVDVGRPTAAVADLRAMFGTVVGGGPPAAEPVSDRRVGAP
jgi:ABC-type Fe3+-hydroxamate transport system substrate-binding protein